MKTAEIVSVLVFLTVFIVPLLALFAYIFLRPAITGRLKAAEAPQTPGGSSPVQSSASKSAETA